MIITPLLSKKRKKKKTPNKRKETNAKSMFLSHGHEEGEKKRSGLESRLISFSKSYNESVLNNKNR
jgi:hypothetical protein